MSDAPPLRAGEIRIATGQIDHLVFMVAVVLGALTIILLKGGLLIIPFSDILGIAIPVSIMMLYAASVSFVSRTRLRYDQAGDNLYYLGFTFTLCSLAITLYRFHTDAGAADYIVSNFGIALATTIVGVVLRVGFHQMRDDPLEVEREARFELTEAVNRLRAEIDHAVREFNHFNRTLQQSAKEAIEAQGTMALESLDKSTKQYADVAVRAVGYLETSFSAFNSQAASLNANAARIADALTALSSRIDAIEAPADLLSAKLAPAFQQIVDAAEQIAGRISSERQRNQNITKLAARLESISDSIERTIKSGTEQERLFSTALERASTMIVQMTETSTRMLQLVEKSIAIEERQAAVATDLDLISRMMSDRDTDRDELLRKALVATTDSIRVFQNRVEDMLRNQSDRFEVELSRAENAFSSLSKTLAEGATLLASELVRGDSR